MRSTPIAWTHSTFNPWLGCLRVSTACDHCYAAAIAKRTGRRDGQGRDLWDAHADRVRTSPDYCNRFAGTGRPSPLARDIGSFVPAWPTSSTTERPRLGGLISGP